VTADGKPIAKAKTPAIAEDIADRLNEDDYRKEQDRWSACSSSLFAAAWVAPLRRIDPTCPVQLLIGRATTNLASGIHQEAYDCDNHNEVAEHASKLEDVPMPVSTHQPTSGEIAPRPSVRSACRGSVRRQA